MAGDSWSPPLAWLACLACVAHGLAAGESYYTRLSRRFGLGSPTSDSECVAWCRDVLPAAQHVAAECCDWRFDASELAAWSGAYRGAPGERGAWLAQRHEQAAFWRIVQHHCRADGPRACKRPRQDWLVTTRTGEWSVYDLGHRLRAQLLQCDDDAGGGGGGVDACAGSFGRFHTADASDTLTYLVFATEPEQARWLARCLQLIGSSYYCLPSLDDCVTIRLANCSGRMTKLQWCAADGRHLPDGAYLAAAVRVLDDEALERQQQMQAYWQSSEPYMRELRLRWARWSDDYVPHSLRAVERNGTSGSGGAWSTMPVPPQHGPYTYIYDVPQSPELARVYIQPRVRYSRAMHDDDDENDTPCRRRCGCGQCMSHNWAGFPIDEWLRDWARGAHDGGDASLETWVLAQAEAYSEQQSERQTCPAAHAPGRGSAQRRDALHADVLVTVEQYVGWVDDWLVDGFRQLAHTACPGVFHNESQWSQYRGEHEYSKTLLSIDDEENVLGPFEPDEEEHCVTMQFWVNSTTTSSFNDDEGEQGRSRRHYKVAPRLFQLCSDRPRCLPSYEQQRAVLGTLSARDRAEREALARENEEEEEEEETS